MNYELIIATGAVIAAFVLAVFWLKSAIVKQNHEELTRLVETRGERIEDLEQLQKEDRESLLKLVGRIEFLERRDTKLIAEQAAEVILEEIRPFLQR